MKRTSHTRKKAAPLQKQFTGGALRSLLIEIRNPLFSFAKIKAFIFDLDDTLYSVPSGAHFFRYGEHLSNFLPEKKRTEYLKELKKSWHNASAVKVGRAFDPETNWILEFDHSFHIKNAFFIHGSPVPEERWHKKYAPKNHVEELKNLVHISSGWGIPTALARFYELDKTHYRAAYLATRQDMRDHPQKFPLTLPKETQTFLKKEREKGNLLIVVTNSDLNDAEEVLEKLKIKKYFHKIYAEAKKPHYFLPILKEIISLFHLEYSHLLVIGDSVYNDLKDAKKCGAQTLLIEHFPNQPLGLVDVRVWSFKGFLKLWEKS